MSTFFGAPTLRLPKISAAFGSLMAQDCILCATLASGRLVCDACARSMPHLAHACEICAIPLAGTGICGECLRRAPALDTALAAFEYRFPLDRLIQRFKYAGDLAVGRWLALELARRAAAAERPALLVAPPLTPRRLRERGFNQAVVTAKIVGAHLGIRHSPDAFSKARDTDVRLEGEHVAIVDDVLTTGATAETLARALKAAGAARVSTWAIARTPDPRGR